MQTEAALRMAHAGLEVTRVDADPSQLAGDPDFPGMEAPRTTLPVVAGAIGLVGAPRRVIIAGHIDTVSPGQREDWSTDPFGGELRDGRLYGRGSLDMKGGVVAGLAALRALVDTETELHGEAVLVTVPSEEDGGAGMLAAIRAGYVAEMAVITEPTRLEIVTAQAGAITFLLTVSGRSAHAAYRLKGVSAHREAARHPRRAAGRRAGTQRERAEPRHARSRPPLPHQPGPHIRRRLVVHRTRPGHRRGTLRRARRRDAGAAEQALRDAVAAACAGGSLAARPPCILA